MNHMTLLRPTFFVATIASFVLTTMTYIVYYPQLEMSQSRNKLAQKHQAEHGTIFYNQLHHRRKLTDWQNREVVRPNNDTLYSSAWIDLSLSKEPLVLTIPEAKKRYYSYQFLAMDTEVFLILGSRKQQSGHFVLASEQWQGELPAGAERVNLPNSTVWLLARYLVKGDDDLVNVHRLQNAIGLQRLSDFAAR